jgi:hypothetical protein
LLISKRFHYFAKRIVFYDQRVVNGGELDTSVAEQKGASQLFKKGF